MLLMLILLIFLLPLLLVYTQLGGVLFSLCNRQYRHTLAFVLSFLILVGLCRFMDLFSSLYGTILVIAYFLPIFLTCTQVGSTFFTLCTGQRYPILSLLIGYISMLGLCGFYAYLNYQNWIFTPLLWEYIASNDEFRSGNYMFFFYTVVWLLYVRFLYLYQKINVPSASFKAMLQQYVQGLFTFLHSTWALLGGFFYFFVYLGCLSEYQRAFTTLDDLQLHTPVAGQYSLWFYAILLLAIRGCALLRRPHGTLPPLQAVFWLLTVLGGIAACAAFLYQLSDRLLSFEGIGTHSPWHGSFQLQYGYTVFLTLFPFQFIGSVILQIKILLTEARPPYPAEEYHTAWKRRAAQLLIDSRRWPGAALLCALPLCAAAWALLQLFGQQPEILLKVFTETSDWTLSQKVSPPTVRYEGHYLCTVAAGGHPALVKPLRHGLRHGRVILVNRQLLVANAFEDLLAAHFPRFHRFVRRAYDRYGYPLSKHIRTPWSADFVYLLMKPFEWLFLTVLYAFDRTPEARIARQYHMPSKV